MSSDGGCLEGKVVAVRYTDVLINVGRVKGVVVGMIFEIPEKQLRVEVVEVREQVSLARLAVPLAGMPVLTARSRRKTVKINLGDQVRQASDDVKSVIIRR